MEIPNNKTQTKFSLAFGIKVELEDHICQAGIAGKHLKQSVLLNEEPAFLVGERRAKHKATTHRSKGL